MFTSVCKCRWALCAVILFAGATLAFAEDYEPPIVITNAKIIPPGEVIENGRILVDKGHIVAVGTDVTAPSNAEVFDAGGMIVYPGFIDADAHAGIAAAEPEQDELTRLLDENPDVREGPQSATVEGYRRLMHPHWRSEEAYDRAKASVDDHRRAGFTAALVSPPVVIFSGRSAVMQLGDLPPRRSVLKANFAQHVAFVSRLPGADFFAEGSRGYPTTTMGAIAAFRQIMDDASWHRDLLAWGQRHAEGQRPALDRDLEALWDIFDKKTFVVISANRENEIQRALNITEEYHVAPIIFGGREAWRVTDRLKRENIPVILSLKWSEEIKKPKEYKGAEATTKPTTSEPWLDRRPLFDEEWESQPFESQKTYDERVRLRNEEVDTAKVLAEAGVRFAFCSDELKSPGDVFKSIREAMKRGLKEDAALSALTRDAAAILGLDQQLGEITPGRLANFTLMDKPFSDEKAKVQWVFVDGKPLRAEEAKKDRKGGKKGGKHGKRGHGESPEGEDEESEDEKPEHATTTAPTVASAITTPSGDAATQPASQPTTSATAEPVKFPSFESEIEADRKPKIQTGGNLVIKHANILTVSGDDLMETDLLIQDGKIAAMGGDVVVPSGATVVDLRGYYVMPGIIDCHSHMCSAGGLNEGSLSVTPEVRVGDVIESRSVEAFRALAGGVTTIHTMHGSANTIGGQNVVLNLKYGRPASEWRFKEAPRTVKFALGENVKQSNWGDKGTRFPNTRMGVEGVLRRSFDAALQYKADWAAYDKAKAAGEDPRPVRHDLRLEALANILDGVIWIHSHCYRSDEILRLLAVTEEYGFRLAVLQHVLEGYRIIPEMRRYGCAASTFSDWWAYKIEAFEAIPQNAARMFQGGIVATVNSDSGEVVRHLNLEAAKSLRFGGLSPHEAIRLCTLNGAISLGIDKYVGSIEVGKRADLAIFDGHPLDTFAKCVMTLIDGEVYFQHPSFDPAEPDKPVPAKKFAASKPPMAIKPSKAGRYWIVGATIHPVGAPAINGGVVSIADGKIERVTAEGGTPPADATVIDAKGLHIYPGLINAGVPLGLIEIDSVAGSVDVRDIAKFQPDLMSLSAYMPFSCEIEVARSEGITSAMIPALGRVVGGQAGIAHLSGWSMPEARVVPAAGLFVSLPSMPVRFDPRLKEDKKEERKKEVRDQWNETEDYFRKAKQYAQALKAAETDPQLAPKRDRRLAAMAPYVRGEAPVFFTANNYKEIKEALGFAEKYGLRPVIHGGREAWKLASELAQAHVDVVVVRSMAYPADDFEPWDSVYRNAAMLDRAGVRFCFATADASLAKQLGVEAGMAVAHGLSAERGVAAVTLDVARILGVGDQLGSLEAGKVADLIVTTDNPLEASNCVVAEFIAGQPVDLSNKHTRSDEKFLARPAPKLAPEPVLRGPPPMRMSKAKSN